MSFDPTWLFLSLIPGGIGFALFAYGKKQDRWPHMAAGLLLMVYPYFATSVGTLVGVGLALGAAVWSPSRSIFSPTSAVTANGTWSSWWINPVPWP